MIQPTSKKLFKQIEMASHSLNVLWVLSGWSSDENGADDANDVADVDYDDYVSEEKKNNDADNVVGEELHVEAAMPMLF